MRPDCVYCGEELWGHRERGGICLSCQGAELDDGADETVHLGYEVLRLLGTGNHDDAAIVAREAKRIREMK